MTRTVSPVPEDFHTITPHLVVRGVVEAVRFYEQAFGARELYRNIAPDGESVIHSEMLLGDSRFFVNDEFPEFGVHSPKHYQGTAVTLHLYVADVDQTFERAVAAGGEVVMPLADQFWGDRYGILTDPFGHKWSVASRLEDLSPQETNQRSREHFEKLSQEGVET